MFKWALVPAVLAIVVVLFMGKAKLEIPKAANPQAKAQE